MTKSESIKEFAAALAKAQGEIKGALKDQANPFFKSKYADLASVVEAIRAPFAKNGIAYVQLTIPSEKEEVQVETILMHLSGEWVSGIIAVPVAKSDAQGYGSALTYARRYGLAAAAGVAPEDDDGNAAAKAAPERGTITPTSGLWEALPVDTQIQLNDLAGETKIMLAKGDVAGACKHLESANLGTDEKAAIWTRFDSKQRSAMKNHQQIAAMRAHDL